MPHHRLQALLALTAFALMVAAPTRAQAVAGDTLVFERVGDRPFKAHDLAFDETGTLWAIRSDVLRLPPGGDVWEEIALLPATNHILPLGPDTLLAGGTSVDRSLDGGQTWVEVDEEGRALFEAVVSGAILTGIGVGSGVAYSYDRGATWQPGEIDTGTWVPVAEAFAELPEEHDHAGRVVAACWAGLSYSDDGGKTWQKSSLWTGGGRYHAYSVAVGIDGRVYAGFYEQWVTGTQVAVSADGGRTYEVAHQFGRLLGVGVRVLSAPGGANPEVGVLLVVEYDGAVWRSDDGAETFRQVGQVPFIVPYPTSYFRDAVLGPDGRLYVAGSRPGPTVTNPEWVYRTVGPVVTAQEPDVPPEETGVRLEVRPNPFRGSAEVTFEVGEAAQIRVAVFDVLGREVAVLAEGPHAAGRYKAVFDARNLAAGRYLVRANAEAAGEARAFVERITVLR